MAIPLKERCCRNPDCDLYGKAGADNIRPHNWLKTKRGKRRRYRCRECGSSSVSTAGTAYHRLRASRDEFDWACDMSARGVSPSDIAYIFNHTTNTINRWLERARKASIDFQDKHLHDFPINELQADEIKTFEGKRKSVTWIMTMMEVSTRLWSSSGIGKRNRKNIRKLITDTFDRGNYRGRPLFTTDGYSQYGKVLKRHYGYSCLHAQIIKKMKKNRVTKVDERIIIGEPWQIADALECSEDSEKLNTSFIERLNLTIRRGISYLQRKTPAHARRSRELFHQLEFFRCYYNFIRPHMALRFGKEYYTPAMVTGIAKRKITWREIMEGRAAGIFLTLLFWNWQDDEILAA